MKLDFHRPLVICRSAVPPEPLEAAFTLGYSCVLCDKPVQVSRTGLKQIRELRGQPLCNACGGFVMKEINKARAPVEIQIGPAAVADIENTTGEPILDTFPGAKTKILEGEDK
jgi:hypothetical protein